MARGTVPVSVSGEAVFRLAADLRRAGATGLRRRLYAGVQRGGKLIVQAAKASAGETLPRRGGLAGRVAGANYRTALKGGRNPGVRITVKERAGRKVDVDTVDRTGRIRHPLYGNRRRWYTTQAPPGWFTLAAQAKAPAARRELRRAVDELERDITGA